MSTATTGDRRAAYEFPSTLCSSSFLCRALAGRDWLQIADRRRPVRRACSFTHDHSFDVVAGAVGADVSPAELDRQVLSVLKAMPSTSSAGARTGWPSKPCLARLEQHRLERFACERDRRAVTARSAARTATRARGQRQASRGSARPAGGPSPAGAARRMRGAGVPGTGSAPPAPVGVPTRPPRRRLPGAPRRPSSRRRGRGAPSPAEKLLVSARSRSMRGRRTCVPRPGVRSRRCSRVSSYSARRTVMRLQP